MTDWFLSYPCLRGVIVEAGELQRFLSSAKALKHRELAEVLLVKVEATTTRYKPWDQMLELLRKWFRRRVINKDEGSKSIILETPSYQSAQSFVYGAETLRGLYGASGCPILEDPEGFDPSNGSKGIQMVDAMPRILKDPQDAAFATAPGADTCNAAEMYIRGEIDNNPLPGNRLLLRVEVRRERILGLL